MRRGKAQDRPPQSPDYENRLPARESTSTRRDGGGAAPSVVRSPGEPLDRETRTTMESRFGHDFSQVRVHADAQADEAARSVGARAYAAGEHLVFKASEYRPHTARGMETLGHELAHVVQQRQGRAAGDAGADLSLSVDAALEAEADRAAGAVANDRSAAPEVGSAAGDHAGSASAGVAQPLLEEIMPYVGPALGFAGMASDPLGWAAGGLSSLVPPGTSYGLDPATSKDGPRPHAFAKTNKYGGAEFGFGGFHGEDDIASFDLGPTFEAKYGMWDEAKDKNDPSAGTDWRAGKKLGYSGTGKSSISFGSLWDGLGNQAGFDFGLGTAGAEASAGSDGLSLGATANAAEIAMTMGSRNKGSSIDETLKLGVSAGEGAAGRLHWGDKDNDEFSEYGFGFDLGPVAMDFKTEDPLRGAAELLAGASPFGLVGGLIAHELLPDDMNLTESVYNELGLTLKGADLESTLDVVSGWLPSMPDLPDLPDLPELPELPDLPSLPDLPDIPFPNPFGGGPGPFFNPTPELPFDLPELPSLPDLPSLPELPSLPSITDITSGIGSTWDSIWE